VAKSNTAVPIEGITRSILILRRQRVILDADLAALYGVATKALNQAVKRNAERFPDDFMFRLTRIETEAVNRSQIVYCSMPAEGYTLVAYPVKQQTSHMQIGPYTFGQPSTSLGDHAQSQRTHQ
jgi:hypothetical protein